jgi:hypothetical protein
MGLTEAADQLRIQSQAMLTFCKNGTLIEVPVNQKPAGISA